MAYVNINGLNCHYQTLGDGNVKVVFIHGLVVDNLSSFYFTLANPVSQYAESLLYDLRGHGKTDRPATGYRQEDFLDDLDALLNHIYPGDPVIIVGNSFGGTLALAYAAFKPERVSGLFTVDGLPPSKGWNEKVAVGLSMSRNDAEQVFDHLYQNWHGIRSSRKVDRLKRNAAAIIGGTSLREDILRSGSLSHNQLACVKCPVMALFGYESDILSSIEVFETCIPHCEIVRIENCTHAVMFEQTETVKNHLILWLDHIKTLPPV